MRHTRQLNSNTITRLGMNFKEYFSRPKPGQQAVQYCKLDAEATRLWGSSGRDRDLSTTVFVVCTPRVLREKTGSEIRPLGVLPRVLYGIRFLFLF